LENQVLENQFRVFCWGYNSDQSLLVTTHPGLRDEIGRSKGQRATHGFMSGFMGRRQKRARLFGIRKLIDLKFLWFSKECFSKISISEFQISEFSPKSFLDFFFSHFSLSQLSDGDFDLFFLEEVSQSLRIFSCGLHPEFLFSFASEESGSRRRNIPKRYKELSYRSTIYENDLENDFLDFFLISKALEKLSGRRRLSIGWHCFSFSGEI
jgi:hypothetical protein